MDDTYSFHPHRLGSIKEYALSLLICKNFDKFFWIIEIMCEFPLRELSYYLINLRNARLFVYPGSDVSIYMRGINLVDQRLQYLREM